MKGLIFIQEGIEINELAHKQLCKEFQAINKEIYNADKSDYSAEARARKNEIIEELTKK